uniref:Uncharacterized protein n=1 Tax=Strongyloides papillosus TaxID=174720 RepID=A0A0N5BXY7_STREA
MTDLAICDPENYADFKCCFNIVEEKIKYLENRVKNLEDEAEANRIGSRRVNSIISQRGEKINELELKLKEIYDKVDLMVSGKKYSSRKKNSKRIRRFDSVPGVGATYDNLSSDTLNSSLSNITEDSQNSDIQKLGGYRKFTSTYLFLKNRKFPCDLCLPSVTLGNSVVQKHCSVECHFTYKSVGLVLEIASLQKPRPRICMMAKCGLEPKFNYKLVKSKGFTHIVIDYGALVGSCFGNTNISLKFRDKPFVNYIYKLLAGV